MSNSNVKLCKDCDDMEIKEAPERNEKWCKKHDMLCLNARSAKADACGNDGKDWKAKSA